MNPISDITVGIARIVHIVGNQIAVAIDPIMVSIGDAVPSDGDVSAIYGSVDIGRRIDIGCFGITVENSCIVCVVSPVFWVFHFISLWIQSPNQKKTVASSQPAPVEMEVIVLVISVAYKSMRGISFIPVTSIGEGTAKIQILFQHFDPL